MRGFRVQDVGVRVSRESTTRRDLPFIERRLNPRPAPSPLYPAPSGLTLIELLITITILATLAAMFLGASNAAMESARASRTKATIAKIHTLLMERWESYSTRRVDFNSATNNWLAGIPDSAIRGRASSDLRLLAIRELMKLEMPDRWSDVLGNNVGNMLPSANAVPLVPGVLASRPSVTNAYLRAYRRMNAPTGTDAESKVMRNQGAECLYLTVMLHTGDGEARTVFSKQDIGDTDGDGALEFLDGWGRPIHFVRWPAGYVYRSQVMRFDPNSPIGGDPDNDHDPFDPFGRDRHEDEKPVGSSQTYRQLYPTPPAYVANAINALDDNFAAFRLVPLIYSSGPDGITDINASPGYVTELDPYARDTNAPNPYQFGIAGDDQGNPDGEDNSIDNIHNHLQEGR